MLLNLHIQSANIKYVLLSARCREKRLSQVRCEAALDWWMAQNQKDLPDQCFETGEAPF